MEQIPNESESIHYERISARIIRLQNAKQKQRGFLYESCAHRQQQLYLHQI